MDERLQAAARAGERSVFGGDPSGLAEAERGLDALQADVDLARGRLLHARFLTERRADPAELALFTAAAACYRTLGDTAGQAEATFSTGLWHHVVRDDPQTATPHFQQALDLATSAGDSSLMAYALRHLAYVALAEGRHNEARHQMERSTELRQELGFTAGVAMNLLSMAEIEAAAGDQAAALTYLDQAEALATDTAAEGVTQAVHRVRQSL